MHLFLADAQRAVGQGLKLLLGRGLFFGVFVGRAGQDGFLFRRLVGPGLPETAIPVFLVGAGLFDGRDLSAGGFSSPSYRNERRSAQDAERPEHRDQSNPFRNRETWC